MKENKEKLCPVCGFEFVESIYNDAGELEADYTICPSCGYEYAVTDLDEGYSFKDWRHKWVAEGMIYAHKTANKDSDWNPKLQFSKIGVELDDKNNIVKEPEEPIWHWVPKP